MGNMILLVLTCLWKGWKDANIMKKRDVLQLALQLNF